MGFSLLAHYPHYHSHTGTRSQTRPEPAPSKSVIVVLEMSELRRWQRSAKRLGRPRQVRLDFANIWQFTTNRLSCSKVWLRKYVGLKTVELELGDSPDRQADRLIIKCVNLTCRSSIIYSLLKIEQNKRNREEIYHDIVHCLCI